MLSSPGQVTRISLRISLRCVWLLAVAPFFLASTPLLLLADPAPKRVKTVDPRTAFEGRTISSISIVVRDLFDPNTDEGVYRLANDIKVNTKHEVVRRELRFHVGEIYDQFKVEESERILRTLGFLDGGDINIRPIANGVDFVDINVVVRDTWTFIPTFDYSTGTGQSNLAVGVGETNLLGYGKRLEFLYRDREGRRGYEGIFEDLRVMGGSTRLLVGLFDRSDGSREIIRYGEPFRGIADNTAWFLSSDSSDTIGRLFEGGEENYIYRQKRHSVSARYTWAFGEPEVVRRRFSLGYDFTNDRFSQATLSDYGDLNLDPGTVSNDPADLAQDRRFSGPVVAYESIEPDFISLAYIDRFDRVQDYNLGQQFSADAGIAPVALGSDTSTLLLNTNLSDGIRFSDRSFMRGELGFNSRLAAGDFSNTLYRAEVKYFHTYDPWFWQTIYLGRHTLAGSFFVDYGQNLDKDRQFLLGGDNALRGYDAKTFSGDKRVVLNLEDRIHFVDNLYEVMSLGGAFFLDVGGASNDPLGDIIGNELFADVGFGLRFAFPRSSGGRVARLDFAVPLRDGPDGTSQFQIRLVFGGGQLFGSNLRSESLGPEKSNVEIGLDR